ncbi:MAG TPA: (d)CMP kinase [Thermoanaerobaculia bacterium]
MIAPLIVAIDGPSGAGKSTVARELARRLGVPYIDTGAMYRAVGLAAQEAGVTLPITDPDAVVALAEGLAIELVPQPSGTRVLSNGRDVSEAIRAPEISLYASAVSAIPGVRRRMVAEQRRMARDRGGVMEGRDIGTRVFPDTPLKFFLTAPDSVRAERRFRELTVRGTPQPYEEVLAEMKNRDRADETRADSPLRFDETYVRVETGGMSPAEVVAELERRVRRD